ncbi:MAG: hypothetical protein PVSMB7_02040 [Chloroflexota bacterium]
MSFRPPGAPFTWKIPSSPEQLFSAAGFVGQAALIVAITFLLARFVSARMRRSLALVIPANDAILLARFVWVSIWTVGILFILYRDKVGFTPLSAFIGVVGLAASLSLQAVLQNLVAGVYLLAERPFAIGDTILVVGPAGVNHEGTVQDIQMRTTHLRTRDDELILVPNASIFSGVITNRTAIGGYIKQATVTFPRDQDPEEIRKRLLTVLQALPSVLTHPSPALRVDKVSKEDWTACINFWASSLEGDADVAWAIARAFPDATVNDAAPA